MKLSKLLFTSTTALGLSMSGALANGNETFLEQQDTGNSASVVQSGNNNKAGRNNLEILQRGDAADMGYNQLTIIQSSDGNEIGLTNGGVVQRDRDQSPLDTQSNVATLIQTGGNNNTIGGVSQFANGGPGTANNPNTLTVTQDGSNNNLSRVNQEGKPNDANVATVTMSGNNSNIDSVEQRVGNSGSGGNELTITMSGANNGNGEFSGGSAAKDSGASAADFVQAVATRTFADVSIAGNRNLVGTKQAGKNNTVGTLAVTGNRNQLGVVQDGAFNEVAMASLAGNANDLGIVQLGERNFADVSVMQDRNTVRSKQVGNDNSTTLDVDGNNNDADILVTGDRNQLNGQQRFGNGNMMEVTIYGSDNNTGGAFSGAAMGAFDTANALTGLPMSSGSLWQHGSNNSLMLNIGEAAGSDSDNNIVAALQRGDGNSINGSIKNGGNNQAAVSQNGNNNATTFTQSGSFNNLGVTQ